MRSSVLAACVLSIASVATLFGQAAKPAAGPGISAAEQEVVAAIGKAKPGDTIVVRTGFYKGGWTLKPGEPGKPITLKAERAGRVFIGQLDIVAGLTPVPGATYSYSRDYPAAPPKLRELDTGKEMRWMATPMDVEEVVGSYWQQPASSLYSTCREP